MSKTVITINKSKAAHVFSGIGVQWDPFNIFPLTESEWDRVVKRVDFLSPEFVRLMIYAPTYCCGLDEDGRPIYDFDCPSVKHLLDELDYLESRKVSVILGEWEAPGRFGGPFEGITADSPKWAQIIGGLLDFLVNKRGYTCIKYFNYVNEANSYWAFCGDYDIWKKGIAHLYDKLCELGISHKIRITGPDSVWDDGEAWLHALSEDKDTADKIGLWDVHMYPTIEEIRGGEVQAKVAEQRSIVSGKDFYMTEVGMVTGKTMGDSQPNVKEYSYGVIMPDIAAQVINGGLNGISIWDLDDAMHNQDNGYPKTDIRSLKQWGFWNSVAGRVFGAHEYENIRPHFYTWSLMSRLFRKGSIVLKPDISAQIDGLRVLVMKTKEGIALMIVNHSDAAVSADVDTGLAGYCAEEYHYSESDRPTDENGFAVSAKQYSGSGMISLEIPAMSVFLVDLKEQI